MLAQLGCALLGPGHARETRPVLSHGGGTVRAMEDVDYLSTFIAVAQDCPAEAGTVPPERKNGPSVAERTYALLAQQAPYTLTSADVLFTVFADRREIPAADRPAARAEFFAKPQPCLRASDLGKRYGWGLHADGQGRLALVGREEPAYAALLEGRAPDGSAVKVVKAMRSARAR